ncbi:hypothetical protein PHMEG_00017160 [Phytophthora megakarya]|uniref:Uncharacterized protein n=1 Tax=Phytophthora megakarya TaxID=4795 RepID=A0A225VZ29_9STRA|nr:hypothetical protein PHMEG_00017160 [Phytophthora megakarya]
MLRSYYSDYVYLPTAVPKAIVVNTPLSPTSVEVSLSTESRERLNHNVRQVVRAMILTYKIDYEDWVLLSVKEQGSNMNHTPVPSLRNKVLVEHFIGLQCLTLMEFYLPSNGDLLDVPHGRNASYRKLKQRLLNNKKERTENSVNFAERGNVLRSRVDKNTATSCK